MFDSEMTLNEALEIVAGLLFDTEPAPQCEYRHAQYDNGTGQGLMVKCKRPAAMWTDRGLRCTDHKGD